MGKFQKTWSKSQKIRYFIIQKSNPNYVPLKKKKNMATAKKYFGLKNDGKQKPVQKMLTEHKVIESFRQTPLDFTKGKQK